MQPGLEAERSSDAAALGVNAPADRPGYMDEYAYRRKRRLEIPLHVAALAVIPVVIIEEQSTSVGWKSTAYIVKWLICGMFLFEYLLMLRLVDDRCAIGLMVVGLGFVAILTAAVAAHPVQVDNAVLEAEVLHLHSRLDDIEALLRSGSTSAGLSCGAGWPGRPGPLRSDRPRLADRRHRRIWPRLRSGGIPQPSAAPAPR